MVRCYGCKILSHTWQVWTHCSAPFTRQPENQSWHHSTYLNASKNVTLNYNISKTIVFIFMKLCVKLRRCKDFKSCKNGNQLSCLTELLWRTNWSQMFTQARLIWLHKSFCILILTPTEFNTENYMKIQMVVWKCWAGELQLLMCFVGSLHVIWTWIDRWIDRYVKIEKDTERERENFYFRD